MTHFQDIDSTLISLGEPERKKAGSIHYVAVPILCGEKSLTMRDSGRLKIFKHGETSFSIGLNVDDSNRQTFEDIEDKIRSETRSLSKYAVRLPAFSNLNPKEFSLIKSNEDGEYPKVYSKLYTTGKGRITARFHEKVSSERPRARASPEKDITPGSKPKKRLIPDPRSMVGVPFDGQIILQLHRLHFGSVKSIAVVAKEVLVENVVQAKSYFDDYSDMEDEGEDTVF